jgi:flagellar protein FlbD
LFPHADLSPHEGDVFRLARHGQERAGTMIQLTRLNNKPLTVNSDLIKFVEQSPDTVITLITGEKIIVLEKADEVLTRIIDFRRMVLQGLPLSCDTSSARALIARSPEPGDHEPEK